MYEIIPGILEKEWPAIKHKIELVRPFTKTLHIDLIDGLFAPNTTFLDPQPFKAYANDFCLELHMMVKNPLQYLKPFAEAGFRRFLGHVEQMPDQAEFVEEAKKLGEVGLVLDAKTPLKALTVSPAALDCLLVMTIPAGFSGQSFRVENLSKAQEVSREYPELMLEVDGGISAQTIIPAQRSGARRFVTTSFLFANNPLKAYLDLSQVLQNSNIA